MDVSGYSGVRWEVVGEVHSLGPSQNQQSLVTNESPTKQSSDQLWIKQEVEDPDVCSLNPLQVESQQNSKDQTELRRKIMQKSSVSSKPNTASARNEFSFVPKLQAINIKQETIEDFESSKSNSVWRMNEGKLASEYVDDVTIKMEPDIDVSEYENLNSDSSSGSLSLITRNIKADIDHGKSVVALKVTAELRSSFAVRVPGSRRQGSVEATMTMPDEIRSVTSKSVCEKNSRTEISEAESCCSSHSVVSQHNTASHFLSEWSKSLSLTTVKPGGVQSSTFSSSDSSTNKGDRNSAKVSSSNRFRSIAPAPPNCHSNSNTSEYTPAEILSIFNNVENGREILSKPVLYPCCSCQDLENTNTGNPPLPNLGIIRFMNKRIFTFIKNSQFYMFMAELDYHNLMPSYDIVHRGIRRMPGSETSEATEDERQFLLRNIPFTTSSIYLESQITPHALHTLYKEACKSNRVWIQHLNCMFYLQRYRHVCPWTILVMPEAATEDLPTLSSYLEQAGLVKKPCRPRILATSGKKNSSASSINPTTCNKLETVSMKDALVTVIKKFASDKLIELFCTCNVQAKQVAKLYQDNKLQNSLADDAKVDEHCTSYKKLLKTSINFQHHVWKVVFMDKELFCWIRPEGFFLSLQELKFQGVLPWKRPMVEDLLFAAKYKQEKQSLKPPEMVVLKPFACSLSGEISVFLLNVNYLHIMFRCMARFSNYWASFVQAKMFLKLPTHECPHDNVNPSINIFSSDSLGPKFKFHVSSESLTTNSAEISKAIAGAHCLYTLKDEENPFNRIICKGRKRKIDEEASTSVSDDDRDLTRKSQKVQKQINDHPIIKSLLSYHISEPVSTFDENLQPRSNDAHKYSFSLSDYKHTCSCPQKMDAFIQRSILCCHAARHRLENLSFDQTLGQAVIMHDGRAKQFYTITKYKTLFFSVGDLQVQEILKTDVDFSLFPKIGPSYWFLEAQPSDLHFLKKNEVRTRISRYGHYLISAELLCFISVIEDIGMVPLKQSNIILHRLGHICFDTDSLAFQIRNLSVPVKDIIEAWGGMPPGSWIPGDKEPGNTSSSLNNGYFVRHTPQNRDKLDDGNINKYPALKDCGLNVMLRRLLPCTKSIETIKCRDSRDYFLCSDMQRGSLSKLINIASSTVEKPDLRKKQDCLHCCYHDSVDGLDILEMFEGKCVKRNSNTRAKPSFTISLECLDEEFMKELLGDEAEKYWIVLTGKVQFSSFLLAAIKFDGELYVNWGECASKPWGIEMIQTNGCLMHLPLYILRPPLDVHMVHHLESYNHNGKPWMHCQAFQAIHDLAVKRGEFSIYPKTLTLIKNVFIDSTPKFMFHDFVLIKKTEDSSVALLDPVPK